MGDTRGPKGLLRGVDTKFQQFLVQRWTGLLNRSCVSCSAYSVRLRALMSIMVPMIRRGFPEPSRRM